MIFRRVSKSLGTVFVGGESAGQATVTKRGTSYSNIPILKSGEEQFILGVVLEPTKELNKPDYQDDIYSAEEVRSACHKWMADYRVRKDAADVVDMGIQHTKSAGERIKIYENYIAPCDLTIDGKHVAKGTWLLGVWVDGEIWDAVKKGEITGFSIGGRARRTRVS
jgi:DNA adenine methylase